MHNNFEEEFLRKEISSHLVVHNPLLTLTKNSILFDDLNTYGNL